MSWSLIQSPHANKGSATAAVDTTGANLLIASLIYYPPSGVPTSVMDSKSNTWIALTAVASQANALGVRLFYCVAPTVGSGHTFTNPAAAENGISVQAWSGAHASPYDAESGHGTASGAPTTLQPGSITPSANGALLVTALGSYQIGSAPSIDSGFTTTDNTSDQYSAAYNHALAYLVQTTAAAINPTWTIPATNDGFTAAAMAAFKVAAGGGGVTIPRFMNQYRQRRA